MASISSSILFSLTIMTLFLLGTRVSAQLSTEYFYNVSCPNALSIIQTEVNKAVANEPRMGASLIRLFFHDCFVDGCDASVLLDDYIDPTNGLVVVSEKKAIPNLNSLRGFEVIDTIKAKLEEACPQNVSCADILAVAARDSVVKLGGKSWSVPLGRKDSRTANLTGANNELPSPSSSLDSLISSFARKGFTAEEMVVLSGAHTVGEARCSSFATRIYTETNIDSGYAQAMKYNCPSTGGDSLAPLDYNSENKFDNSYYKNLAEMKGLLHSDQVLYGTNASTNSTVALYRYKLNKFLTDFGEAMIKMGNLSPLTGSYGEIRTDCKKRN